MSSDRPLETPTQRVAWAIERMKAQGIGLEALAERIGCSHATLSQWKTGATTIENAKVGLISAFAAATGVSLAWLLEGGDVRVSAYLSSEHVAELSRKLVVMEQDNPAAFMIVEKMIDAAASDADPLAHTPPSAAKAKLRPMV